jgi:hypothetical protein
MRAPNPGHERLAMPRFDVQPPSQIGREHIEVVSDDGVELIIPPRRPDFLFVSPTSVALALVPGPLRLSLGGGFRSIR